MKYCRKPQINSQYALVKDKGENGLDTLIKPTGSTEDTGLD